MTEQLKPQANQLAKNILSKLSETVGYCVNIDKKLNTIHNENMQLMSMLKQFNSMNIKSQIPFMSAKQLYVLYQRGWTIEELSGVSGFEPEDIVKKIKRHGGD